MWLQTGAVGLLFCLIYVSHCIKYLTYVNAVCESGYNYSFIHSFIHSGDLYSASSRDYYSEALPAQPRTKKKDLREMENLEGWAISTERCSKGRSFHADGSTIEKALRCIIAKRARGTKNSPLAAERSTRRAARTDTGQQRTRR